MFAITDNKGFAVTFASGVTVSVQFGGGNYCERRDEEIGGDRGKYRVASGDAEIAIIGPGEPGSRPWLTREWRPDLYDDVAGWISADEVLDAMKWAAAYGVTDTGLSPALSA